MMTECTCRTQTALELLSALDSGNNAQIRPQSCDIAELQRQVIAEEDRPSAGALEGLSSFFGSGR